MITVVCFLWVDPEDRYAGRVTYTAQHVNVLRSMLERHFTVTHRLVCVTDTPEGIDERVAIAKPDPRLHPQDGGQGGRRFPKLSIFREDAATWLGGERLLMLDLDMVITGNINHLVNRDEPLVLLRNPNRTRRGWNSSIVLLDAASHSEIYEDFDPDTTPEEIGQATDQGWIRRRVPRSTPSWKPEDVGVVNFEGKDWTPPDHARLVLLTGKFDPATRGEPWVKEHWR